MLNVSEIFKFSFITIQFIIAYNSVLARLVKQQGVLPPHSSSIFTSLLSFVEFHMFPQNMPVGGLTREKGPEPLSYTSTTTLTRRKWLLKMNEWMEISLLRTRSIRMPVDILVDLVAALTGHFIRSVCRQCYVQCIRTPLPCSS